MIYQRSSCSATCSKTFKREAVTPSCQVGATLVPCTDGLDKSVKEQAIIRELPLDVRDGQQRPTKILERHSITTVFAILGQAGLLLVQTNPKEFKHHSTGHESMFRQGVRDASRVLEL